MRNCRIEFARLLTSEKSPVYSMPPLSILSPSWILKGSNKSYKMSLHSSRCLAVYTKLHWFMEDFQRGDQIIIIVLFNMLMKQEQTMRNTDSSLAF